MKQDPASTMQKTGWTIHSFFLVLSGLKKSFTLDVITRGQSTTIFLCIGPFSAWWRTNKQTNEQPGDPSASLLLASVRRQSFAKRCDNDRERRSQIATMRGILAHKPKRDKEQARAILSWELTIFCQTETNKTMKRLWSEKSRLSFTDKQSWIISIPAVEHISSDHRTPTSLSFSPSKEILQSLQ